MEILHKKITNTKLRNITVCLIYITQKYVVLLRNVENEWLLLFAIVVQIFGILSVTPGLLVETIYVWKYK